MQYWVQMVLVAAHVVATGDVLLADESRNSGRTLRARIEARVAADADQASNWRLLGKLRRRDGDQHGARQALETAVQLDPENAAAHCDLAALLYEAGNTDDAISHCRLVLEFAPDSDYATAARRLLKTLSPADSSAHQPAADTVFPEWPTSGFETDTTAPPGDATPGLLNASNADFRLVEQAGYEISRYDNSALVPDADEVAPADRESRRLRARLETGTVYNSNVTLTPINRELFPGSKDTAQFFLAPELEYRVVDSDKWGAGPSFLGHFTFNESNFQNLNLQSVQPGAFLERVFAETPTIVVTRLQYGLTHDAFDGHTIGIRHTMMASAAAVWNATATVDPRAARTLTFGYFSTDHTSILNDGTQPQLSSRDGWTYRLGGAHTVGINQRFLRLVRVGIDLDHADLRGANYAYDAISTYVAAEVPLTETLLLVLEGGWGYRNYPDFVGSPSRNENIWRAGSRLTKKLSDHWSVGGVFNYDRFDSKNALFAADRFLTGLIAICEY
ncbi:tetratricopeptide repeat protein [bacterium]|nr:tetratricopeptide repeat protein [bacterium]